ncbi:MAG: methylenetetrahydrofolate reductase [bacterium]|nr:methylenetetrahydrofolate reductase [bacterium]
MLEAGHFALTGELGPPKGADADNVRKKAGYLKDVVDAVNITDNQTAIVRMSSLASSVIVQQEGLEAVMQITSRDRNRLAIQSDVLGAYAMGIRNILCLSGDHQAFGNHKTAKNVFDVDSIQMLQMLRDMRDEKKFACGDEIKNTKKGPYKEPRIFLGAAANPFGDPMEFRIIRLIKKINAGADFIQTQSIYDMERFKIWLSEICERGLHERAYILAGVTPLKSVKMAEVMRDYVPGMKIPEAIIQRLRDSDAPAEEGKKIAIEQMEELKQLPGLSGIHLMVIGGEKSAPGLAKAAGFHPRPELP